VNAATVLGNLVFPTWCAGCGRWDDVLCDACLRDLFSLPWRNAAPKAPYLTAVRTVAQGLARPGDAEPVVAVWSLGAYEGRRRAAILTWKNTVDERLTRVVREAVRLRVRMACQALPASGCAESRTAAGAWDERDCALWHGGLGERGPVAVVPAPSRWRRRHDGRFVAGHLATAVARGFADAGVPAAVRDVLRYRRVRGSSSLRGREAKSRRIRAVASVREGACVLVDDVVTTGATLAACVRCLEAAGASVLGAYALAAAEDPRKLGATRVTSISPGGGPCLTMEDKDATCLSGTARH